MSFTLTDDSGFLWQKMSLCNSFYLDLFLSNNLMIIFLKLKINKYAYYSKHLKCLKLQSIQLLEAAVFSLTSTETHFDCLVGTLSPYFSDGKTKAPLTFSWDLPFYVKERIVTKISSFSSG